MLGWNTKPGAQFPLLFYQCGWLVTESTITAAIISLPYQTWMIDCDDCGAISGMNEWQGEPKYSMKTFPSAALSTTDPT
jgi:hypothetical protein